MLNLYPKKLHFHENVIIMNVTLLFKYCTLYYYSTCFHYTLKNTLKSTCGVVLWTNKITEHILRHLLNILNTYLITK